MGLGIALGHKRIAEALGLDGTAFTTAAYIPTIEELTEKAKREQEQLQKTHNRVAVERLSDPRQVLRLFQTHALIADDHNVDAADLDAIAAFKENLRDWSDIDVVNWRHVFGQLNSDFALATQYVIRATYLVLLPRVRRNISTPGPSATRQEKRQDALTAPPYPAPNPRSRARSRTRESRPRPRGSARPRSSPSRAARACRRARCRRTTRACRTSCGADP
jgi:hypothetical protein